MEHSNHKIICDFLSADERIKVMEYVNDLNSASETNHATDKLRRSWIFDLTKNVLSKKISDFQSGAHVSCANLPQNILKIAWRIAALIGIPADNVVLQIIDISAGIPIDPHYDITAMGYINYKCNICVQSEDYSFNTDKEVLNIRVGDLHCFEASLYRHWTRATTRRVLLSFSFILPYAALGRCASDPRVRLSERIQRIFQGKNA